MAEFEDVVTKTQNLIMAPTCCYELVEKARAWLKSIGTENEHAAAVEFIKEAEADIVSIDYVIEYAKWIDSKELSDHAKKIKASGGKYCDCEACALAADIIAMKNIIC